MPDGNGSSEFSAGMGGLLGTNDLKSSVDKFSSSVDKLASVVSNMSQSSGDKFSTTSSPAQGSWAKGAKFTSGTFPPMVSASQISGLGSITAAGGGAVPPQQTRQSFPSSSPGSGGGNGGYGGGSAPGQTAGANIAAGISGLVSSFTAYGKNQLPIQVGMNAYSQQAMLGVAPGTPNATGRLYNQAFGTYNNNVNAIANSPSDAAQGQLTLNQIAGSSFPSTTALGQAALGGTAAFGYINPSKGYQGAAQMAGQLYSPQTSLAMRQMGYPSTPRPMQGSGAGFQNTGQVAQSLLQRWYGGKGSVNSNTLNASLALGGKGNLNLQALGLDPSQYGPWLQAYNKLFQQGVSPTKATQLFTQASHNQDNAQNTLDKYGIPNSDLQKLKDNQALLTGRDSGVSSGFNSGLSAATTGLEKFNSALNNILNGPLGKATGYAGGISGTLGSAGGGAMGSGIGSFLGMLGAGKVLGLGGGFGGGGIGGLLGKLFKGGGGEAGAAEGAGGAGILSKIFGGASGSSLMRGGVGLTLADIAERMAVSAVPKAPESALKQAGTGGTFGNIDRAVLGSGANNAVAWGEKYYADPVRNFSSKAMGMAENAGSSMAHMISGIFGGGVSLGGSGSVSISGTAQQSNNKGQTTTSGVSSQVTTAVKDAEAQVGKPYVWGGASPSTSFDCSGLVYWAYGQAGVSIPRTSQAQWAALKGKSIALDKVQEGDIVFAAGSDGTATSPGHEALMVSNNQIVEAAHTGTNIRVRSYSSGEWQHAARPVGGTGAQSGSAANNTAANTSAQPKGNGGMGLGVGSYGSSNETENVEGALLGGISGGTTLGWGSKSSSSANSGSSQPSGNVGNINSPTGFADALLQALGAPTSAANVASIVHWEALEGGNWHNSAKFNPLNTTMHESGSTSMNGVGVQSYTSWAEGVKATVDTLKLAPYTSIVSALKAGSGLNGVSGLGTWSGGAYTSVATGGANLPPGATLVGERGPELVTLSGGENVTSAKKTSDMLRGTSARPAQSPWISSPLATLMYANTPQNNHANTGTTQVHLNFPSGAIVINMPSGSSMSKTDVSNAITQGMAKAMTAIKSDQTITAIAAGCKQG